MYNSILNFVTSITLRDIVYWCLIGILIFTLSISVSKCQSIKAEYKHNIEALNDSIHYLKDKNGNLVATKLAFESDIKTLKLLNEDLYNEIDNLKLKNKISNATYFDGVIENPEQDTTYIVLHDTIDKGFYKDFAFNNEYRTLEGNVSYGNDTVGVNINKDEVKFDYTVAMDKDSRIYIKSNNPYVKYNSITGFTIPKPKTKRWSVGPSINVGYGGTLYNGKIITGPSVTAGISLNYGLFQW